MISQNAHNFSTEHVDQSGLLQQPAEVRLRPESGSSRRHLVQPTHAPAAPFTPSPPSSTTPRPVSPPSPSPSETELDGRDATLDPPTVARSYGPPVIVEGPYRRVPDLPGLAPYPQPWNASRNADMVTDFRDELARLDGVITPGIDNTPFIQYAIEALTRDRDTGYSTAAASGSGSSSPGVRLAPGSLPQDYQPEPLQQSYQPGPSQQHPPRAAPFQTRPPTKHAPAEHTQPDPLRQQVPRPFIPGPRESAHSLAESLLKKGSRPPQPHEWRPVDGEELLSRGVDLPALTFRPWPLRAPALFGFMALCLLMIAALILSAVYSHLHQGLLEWATIHGGRYFLFRILPQLIGAFILLYAQFIATTMLRTLPFARLASELEEEREGALFQELYSSFLRPKLVGPWNVWVPMLVTWLMSFTIPLQSSLFTVILVGQSWTWATVQGVAWTLVALYLALLASTVIVWRYWATLSTTGLIWDVRSLADIATLVSHTNTASDYRGTQLARSRDGIRFALRRRAADRLCYWTWKDGRPGFWHTLGSPMDEANLIPIPDLAAGQRMQRHDEKHGGAFVSTIPGTDHADPDHDNNEPDPESARGSRLPRTRYLPFALRTSPLLWLTVACLILLTAIFVASFLPATHISAGFVPGRGIKADPQPGAFSAADFLYSFVPSILGMVLFLVFQALETHLKVLTPWAAMSDDDHSSSAHGGGGEKAGASLLADYPACAPVQSALHALRNGHLRLAAVSLLSALFVLIPVLAGGMFMALTTAADDGEVRMFPNRPAYYLLLALLVLYLLGLVLLLPGRNRLRMPHAVTCLAEIIGYLVTQEMREEPAFKGCGTRDEMRAKLGVGRGMPTGAESLWVFGFGEGSNMGGSGGGEEGELGVRRVRRFTEKRRVRKSQIRRAFQ
ncbi:hypothetical protein VTI74DRAFT_7868 [Chaetomium olivicolor]